MMSLVKKILTSKVLRFGLSLLLIFFAFRKINFGTMVSELGAINWWWVVLITLYLSLTMCIGGYRWALITLPKVGLKDLLLFTKSTYLGGFYSLLFPSAVGGDILKWIPLLEKYPELSKTKLASSVIIDRIIGFTAFIVMALVALILGKIFNYQFPDIIFWIFLSLNLALAVFYSTVYLIDIEKILGKFKWLRRVDDIISILKKENKNKIFKALLISMVTEPIWILTSWFFALIVHAPISLLQIFIFIPIISLALVLPISVAGFGARENLYLLFFGPLGISDEKLLLMSTFGGIVGIINSLLGGIFLLF